MLHAVGTLACLNSTPALLFSPSRACLSNGGMRVAHICVSGVYVHQVPTFVCIGTSPHSRGAVSVAVAARTCVWFRLQLAHLCCFSLLTPYPPLPSPLFSLHIFPPFPPPPHRACLMPAGAQRSWLTQELRKAGPTMRCRLEMCVSGMKSTGWVTWSSRVWKKVHSPLIELLTMDLFAGEKHGKIDSISFLSLKTAFRGSHHWCKLTSIILSSPFASLPLLISHLSLCALRRKQKSDYTLQMPDFCFVRLVWWKRLTLSQKILTWQAALCMSWLVPELTS